MKKMIITLGLFATLISCKDGFLEVRPNKNLLTPTTLPNLQALLDNFSIMNNYPALTTLSADELVLTDNSLGRVEAAMASAYLWLRDNYQGNSISDWNKQYQQVFYANVVLDGLKDIENNNSVEANVLKGSALFFRAMAMHEAAQIFTRPYASANLEAPGIPYPVESDVNIRPGRKTVKELYDQIIDDLTTAVKFLPSTPPFKSRPSKQACYALLARTYLNMHNYEKALNFANLSLSISQDLIDFNTAKNSIVPFPDVLPNGNPEVIFYQRRYAYTIFNQAVASLEPSLLASFKIGDLRRSVNSFDAGNNIFYFSGFSGLTNGEILLIKAECLARNGNKEDALTTLNQLYIKRCKVNSFIPITAQTAEQTLAIVIEERRKELFGRGLRWMDLRRLNIDPKFAITLKHVYNGTEYILEPNSDGYVFKIPDSEIYTSNITQN